MAERTISIGIQDYEQLQKNQCFYIDKTNFIKEWWENKDIVTLITRPRRFGKTLNMNMVECFFSKRYENRGELFEPYNIWKDETYRKLQGTYPVIFISFANIKGDTFEKAKRSILQVLVKLYSIHDYVKTSEYLNQRDIEFYDSVRMDMPDDVADLSIMYLSDYMSRYYGKKVIILFDEYDTPLQEAYAYGYWQELSGFLRGLFNSTFKTNPYMERGLMTGITRVSKESIFSDLNNLEVVTTTSKKYADCFGFTEEEVFTALKQYHMWEKREEVKKWYDGFVFGNISEIYNPWSIINFLDKKELGAYWVNTSSNGLASKLIREGSPELKMNMERLLEGKTIETELDEQIVFEQLQRKKGSIWSLLLASGYLRVEQRTLDPDTGKCVYHLRITNQEIKLSFQDMIRGWFQCADSYYNDFITALLNNDIEAMNVYMNKVSKEIFSFFDTGRRPSEDTEPERFYHGFVLGLIVELMQRYEITSNRESGFGRYDVMLEPLNSEDDAYIFEFKVQDPNKEKKLEDTLHSALQQIKEKEYDSKLSPRISPEKIRHYGFAFCGKQVLIGVE